MLGGGLEASPPTSRVCDTGLGGGGREGEGFLLLSNLRCSQLWSLEPRSSAPHLPRLQRIQTLPRN